MGFSEETLANIQQQQKDIFNQLLPNASNKTQDMIGFIIDGNIITCYASYSYFDAKSYVTSPKRSVGFVIENLNSYATGLTPRLRIKFSMMPLETYRTIMKLIQSKNEFIVQCYDIVWDRIKTWKAYFEPEDFPELFIYDLHTLGAMNYEIVLTGTNADLDNVSVVYHSNPPPNQGGDVTAGSGDVPMHSEIIIGADAGDIKDNNFGGGYKFKSWNEKPDGTGTTYNDKTVLQINNDLVLYAIWQPTNEITLSFDYGLSSVATETENGILKEIHSKTVQVGQPIGALPTTDTFPKVTIDNDDYYPYYGGGWYTLPNKNSTRVNERTTFEGNNNVTIYRLYDVYSYLVEYITNQSDIQIPTQSIEYGASVVIPILAKNGKTFRGWYDNPQFTGSQISSLKMPPKNIALYAKWE